MRRRCVVDGCDGTPGAFDLECDRHPGCAECGGRGMHDIACRTARIERMTETHRRLAAAAREEEEEPRIVY